MLAEIPVPAILESHDGLGFVGHHGQRAGCRFAATRLEGGGDMGVEGVVVVQVAHDKEILETGDAPAAVDLRLVGGAAAEQQAQAENKEGA